MNDETKPVAVGDEEDLWRYSPCECCGGNHVLELTEAGQAVLDSRARTTPAPSQHSKLADNHPQKRLAWLLDLERNTKAGESVMVNVDLLRALRTPSARDDALEEAAKVAIKAYTDGKSAQDAAQLIRALKGQQS